MFDACSGSRGISFSFPAGNVPARSLPVEPLRSVMAYPEQTPQVQSTLFVTARRCMTSPVSLLCLEDALPGARSGHPASVEALSGPSGIGDGGGHFYAG